MEWKMIFGLCIIVLLFKFPLLHAAIVQTKFVKISGNGVRNIACAKDAGEREFLATAIDGTKTCTSLDRDWKLAPTYDAGSTYFEKKHVVEVYDTPLVLGGPMKLPITFYAGACIDMYIEFTTLDFSYGAIVLIDTLEESHDVYSGESETEMIRMEMKPASDNIIFKTWWFGWVNHAYITPYPFDIGPIYKLTFKALSSELQILYDDVEVDRYNHYVPPEDAKLLKFPDVGILLHKIEFSGV